MFLFGIVSASNEGRSYVGELLSSLYFATIPTDAVTIKKFTKAYLAYGLILVGTRYSPLPRVECWFILRLNYL